MDFGLQGKVALVTGASKGIGLAVATALAREGALLALVARDRKALAEAAAAISAGDPSAVFTVSADLSKADDVERTVSETLKHFSRIDVLINNAGAIRTGPFLEMPDETWLEDWNLKPLSYIRMARAVLPQMAKQGGGRIVNVAGVAARNPVPVYLAGASANAAIIAFTKGLADLGAKSNVLVTAVSPGATRTGRLSAQVEAKARANNRTVEEEWAAKGAEYPLGRLASPEDIAGVVCFLCSRQAAFLSGICITVDGGSSHGVYL